MSLHNMLVTTKHFTVIYLTITELHSNFDTKGILSKILPLFINEEFVIKVYSLEVGFNANLKCHYQKMPACNVFYGLMYWRHKVSLVVG